MNRLYLVAVFVALSLPSGAFAQALYAWTNTSNTSSFYDVADNWSPIGPPGSGDSALFNSDTVAHEVWWDSFTGDSATQETIFSGALGVTFLNLETVQRIHTTSHLVLSPEIFPLTLSNVTLKGIHLEVTATSNIEASTLRVDGNHSAGSGLTTAGTLELENVGLLRIIGGGTGVTENVRMTGGAIVVGGNGSSLIVNNQLEVGVSSSSGTVDVEDGGILVVNGITTFADMASSNVSVSGGGHFDFGTTEIINLANISGSNGSLAGNIFNSETILAGLLVELQGIELDAANLFLHNDGTLLGSATLDCSVCNTSEIRLLDGERLALTPDFGSLFNEGEINCFDGTLDVTGEIVNFGFVAGRGLFVSGDGLSNESVIAFNGVTDILGPVLNYGQIVTSGGATTTFLDDVQNTFDIRTSSNCNTVIFGAASGSGNYTGTGTVYFEGDLQPGDSPAQVLFEGDVVLGDNAITEIEIGGTAVGMFDQLVVDGQFAAGGMLFANTINGFQIQPGMKFEIVSVGMNAVGQFAGLPEGALVATIDDIELTISYVGGDGNDIVLTADSTDVLLGDVNLDGTVNLLDVGPFVELLGGGQYQPEGDINQDGVVNLLDVGPFVNILAGN